MQGRSSLYLTPADTMKAIEYWLNSVILKDPVEVTNVTEQKTLPHDGAFRVDIVSQQKEEQE